MAQFYEINFYFVPTSSGGQTTDYYCKRPNSISWIAIFSYLSATRRFVPFSNTISHGGPRLLEKLRMHIMEELLSSEVSNFKCIALIVRQTNETPHLFS